MNRPTINVTPLIDVLLVLLIIFMVVSPIKPTDFKAKIPQKPEQTASVNPAPDALVVIIDADSTLRLNSETNLGTIDDAAKLTQKLSETFRQRLENHAYADDKVSRTDLSDAEKIQRTVFIKAPRSIDYGSVVRVIDAVKIAGASPISLQIDDLTN